MRRDGLWKTCSQVTLLFALLGWVDVSFAGRIPGGGKSTSDCYAEFDVTGGGPSNKISCTDGDPACDTDFACDGVCTFKARLCVNQTDITGCTSTALKKAPKVTKNLLTVPTFTSAACGPFANITVKLKGKKKNKKGTFKMITTAISASGKPPKDKDTLIFSCLPRTGACPTTTTTTLPPPPPGTLSFSPTIRTSSCGGPSSMGYTTPGAPLSGEIDAGAKLSGGDLGLGCLYVGGGTAAVAASLIPDGTTTFLHIIPGAGTAFTLDASAGTGPQNCSKGAGPATHCVAGTNTGSTCTMDNECGGQSGSCAKDPNCFFGPPLPIANTELAALSTCVLNVIQMDASGSGDLASGTSITTLPLSSQVFLTGNGTAPCPVCVDTVCTGDGTTRCFVDADCSGPGGTCSSHTGTVTCLGGNKDGSACTPVGTLKTSFDCTPTPGLFQAPLPVTLGPLTTAAAMESSSMQCQAGTSQGNACTQDADCPMSHCLDLFCPKQRSVGAFHFPSATTIKEQGLAAGNLADKQPHHGILASTFCIPSTGSVGVDTLADLPGPGAIAIDGMAQVQ